MEYSKEQIERQAESWATDTFGPEFKFREGQKQSVVDTIYAWLTGTKNVISNMPTGSGKSIYAMIVAGVLIKYYNKTGYILVSDLGLLDQYAKDIKKFLPKWTVLKGQQQYKCKINGMPFDSGQCKLMGYKTYSDIFKKCPECARTCPYIIERSKAMESPLTVVTYPFWLIQQNIVKPSVPVPPFDSRDFTICDEAHKLIGIVQQHFSPRIDQSDENKIIKVIEHIDDINEDEMIDRIHNLRKKIFTYTDNDTVLSLLDEYSLALKTIMSKSENLKKELAEEIEKKGSISKDKRALLFDCNFLESHSTEFNDYVDIISEVGSNYMVINPADDGKSITFNCINETYLMDKYFHKQCDNRLYMSATIGDPSVFASDLGVTDYFSINLPSSFDFSNSPIFYVQDYDMSYRERDRSFPRVVELIEATLRMYPNMRGIIQTGSYAFANKLKEMISAELKSRLLLYDGSEEKSFCLDIYKHSENSVLVGPSLIEGLSFDDDLCRFQIIMKVPYPSLKDNFVAAKKDFNPQWYSNTTAVSILQGVGRGVRNEHDWCVTFIFDGCFSFLWSNSHNMFPEEFKKRIQVIPASALVPQ